MKDTIFNEILPHVFKPARYAGGEYNCARMEKNASVRFTLAFPDTYEVGMSHLGIKILYGLLNELPGVNCERVFAPLPDMAQQLKEHHLPLYSLESFSPLSNSDFIGFSIQYEMCITNVLYMLELGQVPLRANNRTEADPIVVAGGPCCVNPEPFCEIFDLIVIGEAEELLPKLMDVYIKTKDRQSFLTAAAQLDGVYVPAFYDVEYDEENRKIHRTAFNGAKDRIQRLYIKNMDHSYYPEQVIIPYVEPVHDRIIQEVMRGCPNGCRFCQAGYIYRPVRQKRVETVNRQADCLIASTGYEEISFSSLSTTDYKGCREVIEHVMQDHKEDKISVSLPSLRIDQFSLEMVKEIQKVRLGALTFAPEAGSQRMRDIINKNVTEEDILSTLKQAFEAGYKKLKLYFMIGLPYEADEDVQAIGILLDRILKLYYGLNLPSKFPTISVSVACFVPKPFTPFQYYAQDRKEEFTRKQKILQRCINRKVKFNYHDAVVSVLESAFARGDRRLNEVIFKAYENGCVFDSWPEHFNETGWKDAFVSCGMDYEQLAQKAFGYNDDLPWDFIEIGIDKEFFVRESEKSKDAATTPNCFEHCANCGISARNGRCEFEI